MEGVKVKPVGKSNASPYPVLCTPGPSHKQSIQSSLTPSAEKRPRLAQSPDRRFRANMAMQPGCSHPWETQTNKPFSCQKPQNGTISSPRPPGAKCTANCEYNSPSTPLHSLDYKQSLLTSTTDHFSSSHMHPPPTPAWLLLGV